MKLATMRTSAVASVLIVAIVASIFLAASEAGKSLRRRKDGPPPRKQKLKGPLSLRQFLRPKASSTRRVAYRMEDEDFEDEEYVDDEEDFREEDEEEEIRAERRDDEEDEIEEREDKNYKRDKRFFPVELGCVKGYICCEIPRCRPYCSLCNGGSVGGGKN